MPERVLSIDVGALEKFKSLSANEKEVILLCIAAYEAGKASAAQTA